MAESPRSPQRLTLGQGIGIGVVVGFVVALLLVGIVFFIAKAYPFSSMSLTLKTFLGFHRPSPTPPAAPVADFSLSSGIVWARTPNPNGGKPKWKPNPPAHDVKNLPYRMRPMQFGTCIHEVLPFEFSIDQMVLQCIIGHDGTGYQMPQVPPSIFSDDELNRLAGDPVNGGTWSESLSNLKTRGGAVRCFLAQVLFKHMDPHCNAEEGLLPTEIAALYQLLDHQVGPFKPEPTESERLHYDTFAVWREVVHLLLKDFYYIRHDHTMELKPGDTRKERTYALMNKVVDALKLKTLNVMETTEVFEHRLKAAFEMATCSALALFSQPSVWEYEWVSKEPGFMVFPEVRLVWDEDHVKYSQPAKIEVQYPPPPSP